ncbi:MAG TPA: hypothetical protein VFO94_09390 [Gammaproteobacteria bacterium]|nr:hypothetical protein [Gammaproteobacteria bacterium]
MKSDRPKRFVASERELDLGELGVELWACPHCKKNGTLIGHGYLRGYAERGQERVLRGRRLFCSNRHRRSGCGRTFSVKLSTVIAGFMVRTLTLFRFASAVVGGLTRRAGWLCAAGGVLSLSSGYRLWRGLCAAQSALRAQLCREAPAPACASREPLAQLIAHIALVLGAGVAAGDADLFATLQLCLEHGLFDG